MKRILCLSLLAFVATTILQAKDVAVFVQPKRGARKAGDLLPFTTDPASKISYSDTKILNVPVRTTHVDLSGAKSKGKTYTITKDFDNNNEPVYTVCIKKSAMLEQVAYDPAKEKNVWGFEGITATSSNGDWCFTLKKDAGLTIQE